MLRYRCGEKPHQNHQLRVTGKPWGQTKHSPAPHQHQHAHRAACAVASTSREDAAHCGAGPPCTFRYAPIPSQTPTTNNPPRWYPSIHRHNTRTTHSGPPQATPLRASNPRPLPSGPQIIPLYYTEDPIPATQNTRHGHASPKQPQGSLRAQTNPPPGACPPNHAGTTTPPPSQ